MPIATHRDGPSRSPQEQGGEHGDDERRRHVDRGGVGERKMKQRHEKEHRRDRVDDGAHRDPSARDLPDPPRRARRVRHGQHQQRGHHPADEDELRGRHRLARVLDQRIVDDEARHRADHREDADAIGVRSARHVSAGTRLAAARVRVDVASWQGDGRAHYRRARVELRRKDRAR